MLKKIFIIFITITLLLGICGSVNATELKTRLDVIQQSSETKYLENDQGYISKTIVNSNGETGEVNIELKLSNTKQESEENIETEIFIVVDNSPSMDFVTSTGETRKELVLSSAKQLVTSIFDNSNNVKIGLIDFHGAGGFSSASKLNATVRQRLTDNKDTALAAIEQQLNRNTSSGTNIQSGLIKAQENFTENANKIVILLSDGIPNADINGNSEHRDITSDKGIAIQDATKQTLLNLKNEGIYTITLLTGMSESDGNTDKDGTVYDSENTIEEELAAAERVFGTETNPTANKYYLVNNININTVITQDILRDVVVKIQSPINTVKVVDYFPEDITENFEFSYVGNPNVGTITEGIDKETKTISWDIGTLRGDETATLQYKLKLKDMGNTNLLNKTIATNEKVELTYTDVNSEEYTVTLTSSPRIKLTEVKEELTATVTYNPTTNTREKVTATIKTNKKVNEVEGWTLSEDGKTLTKEYTTNTTETVHLVDIDNMTKDVVVEISNIIEEELRQPEEPPKDNTTSTEKLPQTGASLTIIMSLIAITIISISIYKKYNSYKEIK